MAQTDAHDKLQVMNQELVSPTILGFPLRMKINATGLLNFTQESTFQASLPGESMTVEGRLFPTAVVAVDQTLMVGKEEASGSKRFIPYGLR